MSEPAPMPSYWSLANEVTHLRGKLDQLQAENAELRDDLQRANDAVCDAEHDESRAWDRVRKVEAENAKLRKLLLDFRDSMWDYGEWTEPFDERMLELGVFSGRW